MKKYQEIFSKLKEKILMDDYPSNQLLPTELELRTEYDVSRDTIRKALALLTDVGLIQKVQGRGSLVIKNEQIDFPVSGLTSYQELVEIQGLKSKTEVVSLELLTLDSNLALLTGFEHYAKVWKVVRTREIDGKVVVIDTDYLLYDLIPDLTKEIAEKSIYAYLEGELNFDISYAHKEITVEPSNVTEKKIMQMKDDYLVLIKSRVFLSSAQQFQYTESRHKLDKFKFVDFARRKHNL